MLGFTAMHLLEEKLEEEAGWPEQERSLFQLDPIGMWTIYLNRTGLLVTSIPSKD